MAVTIQAVDQEWVKMTIKQKKPFDLIMKVADITAVSRIL